MLFEQYLLQTLASYDREDLTTEPINAELAREFGATPQDIRILNASVNALNEFEKWYRTLS